MPVIGKVYKAVADNNLLRTVIYDGPQVTEMMNVDQDNTQTIEFTLNTVANYQQNTGSFATAWEEVEGLEIKSQVDAHMAPKYT